MHFENRSIELPSTRFKFIDQPVQLSPSQADLTPSKKLDKNIYQTISNLFALLEEYIN